MSIGTNLLETRPTLCFVINVCYKFKHKVTFKFCASSLFATWWNCTFAVFPVCLLWATLLDNGLENYTNI